MKWVIKEFINKIFPVEFNSKGKIDDNFSIVKCMAEAARLYNEYYKRNMNKLEHFDYSFDHSLEDYLYESAYDKILIEINPAEYEIKCMAVHNSQINFNEKKEKEAEIERIYSRKINACYMELNHE